MTTTIGIIGDIHLDLAAATSTLDGPLAGCDRVICTGDFLDRGPGDPAAVLDELLRRGVELTVGNHELAYLGARTMEGVTEPSGFAVADRLRQLVLDGDLRATRTAGDVLCNHGGVSRRFWERELADIAGTSVGAIASLLNRQLVLAVARRDFGHAMFATMEGPDPGPFWARIDDDLLVPGLPPFRQAVGHVAMPEAVWLASGDGPGSVFPLDRGMSGPTGLLGHLVVEVAV